MQMIRRNMTEELEHCHEAPFYTLSTHDRYSSGLRPLYLGYWCSNDRLVWLCDALLCNT